MTIWAEVLRKSRSDRGGQLAGWGTRVRDRDPARNHAIRLEADQDLADEREHIERDDAVLHRERLGAQQPVPSSSRKAPAWAPFRAPVKNVWPGSKDSTSSMRCSTRLWNAPSM